MHTTSPCAGRALFRRPHSLFSARSARALCQSSIQRQSPRSHGPIDVVATLAHPTWSVRSLISDGKDADTAEARITPKQLHHLLRLSALPLPSSPDEESRMIDVLQSQLLFVRDIQAVETSGVEPLRSIRDETEAGLDEATIGVEQLRDALSQEVAFGRSRRPRRQKRTEKAAPEADGWNPLHTASQTVGPYFVVRSGKNKSQ